MVVSLDLHCGALARGGDRRRVFRAEGLDRIVDRGIPNLTATRAGVAVNPYDASTFSIASATSAATDAKNTVTSFGVNVARDFDFSR